MMISDVKAVIQNNELSQYPSIGEGITSIVYNIFGYAVKVKKRDSVHDFSSEALKMKAIENFGYTPKVYYHDEDVIIMELIQGKSIKQYLDEGFVLNESHVKKTQVALDLFRSKGIIASDLHVENMFITPEGDIQFIDLGRYLWNTDNPHIVSAAFQEHDRLLKNIRNQFRKAMEVSVKVDLEQLRQSMENIQSLLLKQDF